MKYILTDHANVVLKERNIPIEYVERALSTPVIICEDAHDVTLEHRLCTIKENGNRVLCVIINKTVDPVAVVTVYFDRKMKGKV